MKSFSLTELTATTRNFRKDSVLEEGGFGSVFKGWIDDISLSVAKPGTGIVVAVKRLNQDSFQGHKDWLVSSEEETILPQFYDYNAIWCNWYFDTILHHITRCHTLFREIGHWLPQNWTLSSNWSNIFSNRFGLNIKNAR